MSKLVEAIKLVKIVPFLEEYKIKNYTINDDLTVDVEGDVDIENGGRRGLKEIPIQFGKVTGVFDCSYNNLISLKGCPRWVGGSFYCSFNRFTTLEGSPEYVGGSFSCLGYELRTLKGCPREVGGDFSCNYNSDLKSLKGIGHIKGKISSDFFKGKLEDYKGKL